MLFPFLIGNGETWHTPVVCYAYTVGEQRYESEDGMAEAPSATTPDYAQRQIARYPVGARIAVRYDPQIPQRSLLNPFPSPWEIFGLALGLGMIACATISGIWLATLAVAVVVARS
ncbi:MAG TPA: DUF3592 domain-containing protein [Roseiflexaceae bacterium]|nr:DUF3592 domain-containing protein [Roseiflexaceae bacterium]